MERKDQRPKRIRRSDLLSRNALQALIFPVCSICVAAIAGGVLGLRRGGPDLFDLTPNVANLNGYALVAWYELERGRHELRAGGLASGSPTRILGYMMKGEQPIPGSGMVGSFVLLPDAGSPIHPAHRYGDQMIEVRLREGEAARFAEGSLVWAWGCWKALPGDPAGDRPLYGLVDAQIQAANTMEILKYFRW